MGNHLGALGMNHGATYEETCVIDDGVLTLALISGCTVAQTITTVVQTPRCSD